MGPLLTAYLELTPTITTTLLSPTALAVDLIITFVLAEEAKAALSKEVAVLANYFKFAESMVKVPFSHSFSHYPTCLAYSVIVAKCQYFVKIKW